MATIRGRRKSTAHKSLAESDEEENSAETIRNTARNSRISHAEDEVLLQVYVMHFEDINDTTTIRGIPSSKNVKQRQQREEEAWENIATEMNQNTDTERTVEYFKTKFKNMKQIARSIDSVLKKQQITGGGQLKNQEQRIIKSVGYMELAKKLGTSASGNVPRDSDSTASHIVAPTPRTQTLAQEKEAHEMGIRFFGLFSGFISYFNSCLNFSSTIGRNE